MESIPPFNVSRRDALLTVLASGIGLILTYYTLIALYNIFLHPLRHVPGPTLAALSPLPHSIQILTGNISWWLKQQHAHYGEIVRIAPNEVSFSSGATAWQDIYGFHPAAQRAGHYYHKDRRYFAPPVNGVQALITADPANHARMRRVVSHAFSDRALREQEGLLKGYVEKLVGRISRAVESGRGTGVLNMVDYYTFFTFDVISDLAFGESFHCLDGDGYHEGVYATFASAKQGSLFLGLQDYPVLYAALKKLFPSTFIAKREGYFHWARRAVTKRLEEGMTGERADFIEHILKHANSEKGLAMSREEMDSNAVLFMAAGSETTATTLAGVTALLLLHPEKLAKLKQEVRGTFSDGSQVNIDAVGQLTYLQACLSEALRLYPPVGSGFGRIVPEGGDTISGQFVPGGTGVSVTHLATYHSPENFASPESFVPERWLEDRDAKYANDKRAALQPFSFGPRNCLGKNLAYAEMRLMLARIILEFDMEFAKPIGKDWFKQKSFLIWEKKELPVRFWPAAK